jgi:hypothetical protein
VLKTAEGNGSISANQAHSIPIAPQLRVCGATPEQIDP